MPELKLLWEQVGTQEMLDKRIWRRNPKWRDNENEVSSNNEKRRGQVQEEQKAETKDEEKVRQKKE